MINDNCVFIQNHHSEQARVSLGRVSTLNVSLAYLEFQDSHYLAGGPREICISRRWDFCVASLKVAFDVHHDSEVGVNDKKKARHPVEW